MGDVIELRTTPGKMNVFYKISSHRLNFEVRTEICAAIGLSRNPSYDDYDVIDVWVVLANTEEEYQERTRIVPVLATQETPNILSKTEYRQFWLSWDSEYIQLGRSHESKPFIKTTNNLPDLDYITFSSIVLRGPYGPVDRSIVDWRFELPPLLEQLKITSITHGELQWIRADDQLPDGALIGGHEKEILYIIRAAHRGSLTPGKFVPSQGTGYVSWGGADHEKEEFEVLCGFDCAWVPTFEDKIPVNAVEGGHSEDRHEKLYVGRATYKGYLIPGKVQPSHKVCYIPFEGREIGLKNFEILVSQNIHSRSARKLFIRLPQPPDARFLG